MPIVVDLLKETTLVVADHDSTSAEQLAKVFQAAGFHDIRHVGSSDQIFQLLRPFHDQPEKVFLIVIKEDLPDCNVSDLCQSLSCDRTGVGIPFITLGSPNASTEIQPRTKPQVSLNGSLIYRVFAPYSAGELVLVGKFLLTLKRERMLRYKQEEQLINELANKNVMDAKLKFLVAHDELTGLLNRSSFERQLRLILNLSNKLHKKGALLFIDVDRFSMINELEGFDVGDRLLVELTILIRKLTPASSLFARIGSDEFCLFLENKSQKQAQIFAETIKTSIENYRFFTGEVGYSTTVSIGIAALEQNDCIQHSSEMILHGRQACNIAKHGGGNRISFYDPDDLAILERRLDIYWVPIIRQALRDNNFFLVFQPVVELNNGFISHYEVLLRMRGESNETISPDKFIPPAERMGLIHAIDLWVVEHAIDFLAGLPANLSYISLAVNLSGSAFLSPSLLQVIRDKLEVSWIDASRLTFEITETAAVDNFDQARNMINQIRGLGCKFALDDFGAGFCSFNYLKMFPVDYVKIDGQFIRNLIHDETDQILVKSMVEIAAKLGKQTIAEFVESEITVVKLKEIGVHMGQGYAFGRPERTLLNSQQIQIAELLNTNNMSSLHKIN